MGGPAIIDGNLHEECDNFLETVFTLGEITYNTSEQYFQCQKATNEDEFNLILNSGGPMAAWAKGNKITLRKDWEAVKVQIMYEGNLAKFVQNPILAEKLCNSTGQAKFTGSTPFWNKWNGLIMERIRAELRGSEDDLKKAGEIEQLMNEYSESKTK